MHSTNRFTFLYAEDDSVIRSGYIKYFETIFERVYEAKDGKEAYLLYKKHKPDILLFDINMPYLNGLELIKKIREIDKEVKIIILTAYKDEEKLLQAIPLHVVDYLVKPVKKRDLETLLLSVMLELNAKDELLSIVRLSKTMVWDKEKSILMDNDTVIHLTRSEIILLNILSSKSAIFYSIDKLLEEFWLHPNQKNMTQDSIRNIIKRLKGKLPKNSIQNHYGMGYQLLIT